MNKDFSKAMCPNCGQHIEYPAGTEATSVNCPECSKPIPIAAGPVAAAAKAPPAPARLISPIAENLPRRSSPFAGHTALLLCVFAFGFLGAWLQNWWARRTPVAWEYRISSGMSVKYFSEDGLSRYVTARETYELNRYEGNDGWELVHVGQSAPEGKLIYFFKRPCSRQSEERMERHWEILQKVMRDTDRRLGERTTNSGSR